MDIKTDNILMNDQFCLKLTDFDVSFMEGDRQLFYKGTPHFRAPELLKEEMPNPYKCDIYSAGIILFILKFGHLPYDEHRDIRGYNLRELLYNDPQQFWQVHEKFRGEGFSVSSNFK